MQCFQKNVYLLILIQIHLFPYEAITSIAVLDKGLVSLQKDSVAVQFYVDIENKDRLSGCVVRSWAENCCLTDGEEDCGTMAVYGGNYYVKPKDRETLIFIYPSMYQYDQVGYCNLILQYQCGKTRKSKRQRVDVAFDTRLVPNNELVEHYREGRSAVSCDTLDQDSLHDCEPVNCEMKYGGEKPYFDGYIGKCVEATLCESDPDSELPDVVYVPSINSCRDLEHPLTVGDIYAISTGMGVVTQAPSSDEVKVEVRSNCSTVSQNLKLLRDIMYGKLCPLLKSDMSDYSNCCKSAVLSIVTYIGSVCALLLSFFCCVQTTAWLHRKFSEGEFKNFLDNFKNMFKTPASRSYFEPGVSSEVRETLLREVIVRDIPIELRDSIVNICDKVGKKVKKKKRYRSKDVGSQISLRRAECDVRASVTSSTSSLVDCDKRQILLK